MLVPNRMVRGGSVTLERVGERGKGTRVCSDLDLGPPEAQPTRQGFGDRQCIGKMKQGNQVRG